MKKGILLSRAEMKNVLGGGKPVVVGPGVDGCSDSSVCNVGQECCPFTDSTGSVGYRCSDLFEGPDGSMVCGNA